MTVTLRHGAAAIVVAALLVAACGSATAPSPTVTGPSVAPSDAGSAASSTAPTSAPDGSNAPGSPGAPTPTPLPTFTRVADLEALLPTSFNGKPTRITSLSGTDVLATGRPQDVQALQAILAATGGQPADYGFAYSQIPGASGLSGEASIIGAFRVKGADATKVRDSLVAQGKGASGTAYKLGTATVGGKPVTTITVSSGGTEWTSYYWPKGDVLFFVQTTDPTVAESFFSGL